MERLTRLTPMLQAREMQRTIDFYTEILDFKLSSSWPKENPVWCMLERDSASVMFMINEHVGEPRMSGTLYMETTDVLALYNRISGKVEVQWGPEVYEYGMHEFAIKDCNGYTLSFGQPVEPKDGAPPSEPHRDP
jgi:uncharacterized glyoxalase superfamily protein PhnB